MKTRNATKRPENRETFTLKWVGQNVVAVHQMETQMAQDEASRTAVGSYLCAGKVIHYGIFDKNYSLSSCTSCPFFANRHV